MDMTKIQRVDPSSEFRGDKFREILLRAEIRRLQGRISTLENDRAKYSTSSAGAIVLGILGLALAGLGIISCIAIIVDSGVTTLALVRGFGSGLLPFLLGVIALAKCRRMLSNLNDIRQFDEYIQDQLTDSAQQLAKALSELRQIGDRQR
jgi:hypothetical protein